MQACAYFRRMTDRGREHRCTTGSGSARARSGRAAGPWLPRSGRARRASTRRSASSSWTGGQSRLTCEPVAVRRSLPAARRAGHPAGVVGRMGSISSIPIENKVDIERRVRHHAAQQWPAIRSSGSGSGSAAHSPTSPRSSPPYGAVQPLCRVRYEGDEYGSRSGVPATNDYDDTRLADGSTASTPGSRPRPRRHALRQQLTPD